VRFEIKNLNKHSPSPCSRGNRRYSLAAMGSLASIALARPVALRVASEEGSRLFGRMFGPEPLEKPAAGIEPATS
jgi:hypothetical protein